MDRFLKQRYDAKPVVSSRMLSAVFMQGWYTSSCDEPKETMVTGKTVLLTGGSVGIGFETAKGLVQRGAYVIIVNRTASKLEEARRKLAAFCADGGVVDTMTLDLSDLGAVSDFGRRFSVKYPGRKIDLLIENAGLWPRSHSNSPQGYESAVATNLLGHYLLRSILHKNRVLAEQARIVVVTGDIYIKADDCTLQFDYGGEGEMAYCRSKLGVHWLFNEFHLQYPEYEMLIVHPGVIRTELALDDNAMFGLSRWLKSAILLDEAAGCQTTLIAAVAPSSKIINGGYYHNTCGLMNLEPEDPVNNKVKSQALCAAVNAAIQPYL